jgi:hypothetical protein
MDTRDLAWLADEAQTHDTCALTVHRVLTAVSYGETEPNIHAAARSWIEWYFAHHCKLCGRCDNIENLLPDLDGLCTPCWKDTHEQQRRQGVTSTA